MQAFSEGVGLRRDEPVNEFGFRLVHLGASGTARWIRPICT